MKLLKARRRLELKIIHKNGLIEKLLSWYMPAKNCFFKFKKSKLHSDEENYKKGKYQVQNFIRKKKEEFYETNLRQKINKPKKL